MLVFTSCTNNYLPKARVLAQSVKKWHPDWEFCLLLGEKPPQDFNLEQEPFDRVLGFDELDIEDYRIWLFRHRVVEICTAAKGEAMNYFLEREKRDKVIYLDPDIMVLNSLEPIEKALDEHAILLTPHQLAPQKGARAIEDNEICSLKHGVYNLGFLACAGRGQGIDFSRFWRDRLREYCYDDKENGLFTDQRWCDLAPAYFSDLGIVRDPGCNAASWNLTDRTITRENGVFLANGQPLRFYHFTGYDSGMGKIMSSIYGASMPAVKELWDIYASRLTEAGHEKMKKIPWAGNFYSNGDKITDEARYYLRMHPDLYAIFPDPFETDKAGATGFRAYFHDLKTNRENRLWAIARKPFRLAHLTALYLARNGGLKGIAPLYLKTRDIWRKEGARGVLGKVREFRQKSGVGTIKIDLAAISNPKNEILRQWRRALGEAFSGRGVLLIDHMYGGGANDYRETRIKAFLDEGVPVLLATWDFFAKKLVLEARLPGNPPRKLKFEASGLGELAGQDCMRFGRITLNELVLWSVPGERFANHLEAVPEILATILAIKEKNGSFLEIDIHDYYCACPNYNLLRNDREFCGLDDSGCQVCMATSRFGMPRDMNLAAWRAAWQKLFDNADEIRVFSRASLDILRKKFNLPDNRVRVLPHKPLETFPVKSAIPSSGPMRVGVLGNIAWHKGADLVCELAKMLNADESVVVIGELEASGEIPANVTVHGQYRRQELPELMQRYGITVAFIPSIWPETFCYTAQECMELGLPLVTLPLGAQAERTAGYEKGRVAADVSAKGALAALRELDEKRRK